jgi:ABC-type uncharacterized transport system involved in gliding motility auxiliary subunit
MKQGGRILFDRVGLLVLALVFLAGVAVVTLLPAARVDLTENQLYTLSEGTRKIVGTIPEPVNVYLFFSDKATADLPQLRTYAGRVREMLEEFANRSDGKLKLRVIDPLPFSEEEDRATAFGLRPINLGNNADPVFFGIAATNSVGDDEIIPFLDPAKEAFLEYDLARLVYALANPKKPVVGLLSTLPMTAGFDPMTQQIRQPWVISDQLRQLFDLRTLQPDLDRLEDDIQVLMLVHPKNLPDSALYAIDQFIVKGGRAVIFADPYAEMDQGDPADPMGGAPADRASDLERLFGAWGISVDTGNVVGDDRYALSVGGADGGPVRHLGIIGVTQDSMSQDDVITSGLGVVNMAFAGHITRAKEAAAEVTPVIQSSDKAALIPVSRLVAGLRPGRPSRRLRAHWRPVHPRGPHHRQGAERLPRRRPAGARGGGGRAGQHPAGGGHGPAVRSALGADPGVPRTASDDSFRQQRRPGGECPGQPPRQQRPHQHPEPGHVPEAVHAGPGPAAGRGAALPVRRGAVAG